MDEKLKPCPFCGHEAIVDDCGEHRYFVKCSHCCINQDKLFSQKCDAIRAWNRRRVMSRQAVIKPVTRHYRIDSGLIESIDHEIELLPSAEPERKTGKWIFKNDLRQFFCSECGFPSLTYDDVYIYSMDLPNFCEDCGADMRGEQDE